MDRKEFISGIIPSLIVGLFLLFVGLIFTGDNLTTRTIGIFGSIGVFISGLWYYQHKKEKFLWNIKTEKVFSKIKFSVDVHKSSNWEKDNQFFLCIHNESFFKDIKYLSVVIAVVNKVENGVSSIALNRSVILHENLVIPKMRASADFPFLEVVKKDNKFVIRAIHQESPNKEIFEHEFGYGEYIIHLVIKRKDTGQDSIAIPIHIKYDGWNKISGKVHDMIPNKMFPMSV